MFLNWQILLMVVILALREFHRVTPAKLTVIDFMVVRTYFLLNLLLCLVLYELELIVNNDSIPIENTLFFTLNITISVLQAIKSTNFNIPHL